MKTVISKLSMVSIPEMALIHGVVKLLDGREAFKDADSSNQERIYYGDVFEAILNEIGESGHTVICPPQKVIDQLEELSKLVSSDYVMITLP